MRLTMKFLVPVVILMFVSSCASGPVGGTANSKAPYEKVFQACIDAASDISYSVTTADKNSGFISAAYGRGPSEIRLSINVRTSGSVTTVDANFIPPARTIGHPDYKRMYQSYMDGLTRRVPDMTITARRPS